MEETKHSLAPRARALTLLEAALNLQQAGEFDSARNTLLKAAKLDPDYAPIQLSLGMVYQELGEQAEAEFSFRQALRVQPNYPEALLALGLLLLACKRYGEAADFLKTHHEQVPTDAAGLKALTTALRQQGQTKEALDILQNTWENTLAEAAGVQYGQLLIQLEALDQARSVLADVSKRHPSARTLSELALVLILQQDDEAAIDALQVAVKQDPTFDRAWRGLAGAYDRLGQYDKALAAAEKALELDSRHYRNWMALSGVLLSLERYEASLEAARKGIALIAPEDEGSRPVLLQLLQLEVQALLGMQAFSEASQRLHHIRREYKENTFVRMHFGLLFSLGRYEDALQVLNEAREEGFTSSPALYYQVLHALRRHDEAWAIVRPDLEDVTPEIRDDRVESLVGAGIQFYVRGDADVARIVFAQLLQVSPDNPRLLNNLGFIALGERNLSRAEAYLTKALEASEPDWQTVVALNIGYLRLLQQDYAQAEEALALAEARVEGEEGSIPLIAYWRNGEVLPEYTPYPRVFYPIELSIWANRVTLDLALEDPEAAETLARRIVEVAPNLSVGYRVLGWALVAQSRLDEARSTWETALPYAREDAERQALQQWLADFS